MNRERRYERDPGHHAPGRTSSNDAQPGKRTLVEASAPPAGGAEQLQRQAAAPGPSPRSGPAPTPLPLTALFGRRDTRLDPPGDAEAEQPPDAAEAVASGSTASAGGGQGLAPAVRAQMERSFATDLSGVRIHEAPQASAMGALAYTQGSNIYFAPGQYDPHTQAGQELLGHELAHVIQQSQGRVAATAQAKGVAVNDDPALEREADEMGARAARGEPAGNSAGTAVAGLAGDLPVQRKIGFELEAASVYSAKYKTKRSGVSGLFGKEKRVVDTKKSRIYSGADVQGRDYLGDGELLDPQGKPFPFEALRKKDVILDGQGFKLEADEQNDGLRSNIEFVTSPFPETLEGAQELASTMHNIVMLAEMITARAAELHKSRGFMDVSELARFGTPSPDLLLIPTPESKLDAVLQVTAAIRLDSIAFLMYNMAAPEGEDPATTDSLLHTRAALGAGIHGGARSESPTAMAPFAAEDAVRRFKQETAINAIWNTYYRERKDGMSFGSDELKGLLALIVQYMRTAATPLGGYPKTIAPLMARTDFAQIFSMVPESIYFKRDPDHFIQLAHMAVGPQYAMGDALFTGGIYHSKPRLAGQRDVLRDLSRRTWLTDMAQGVDRLTAAHFNEDGSQQPHLESLGSYGDKVETVGRGGTQLDAPIFEIRSMGSIPMGMWYPRVMDVFLFLASLNSPHPNKYKDTILDSHPELSAKVRSKDQDTRLQALAKLTRLLDQTAKAALG